MLNYFRQYIAGYTVTNILYYTIRRHVTKVHYNSIFGAKQHIHKGLLTIFRILKTTNGKKVCNR